MNPLRRALLGLGAAGIVIGVPITAVIATSDHTNLSGLIAGLSLLVGLVVPRHRPVCMGPPPGQPDRPADGGARVQLAARRAVGLERPRPVHRRGAAGLACPSQSSPTSCSRSQAGGSSIARIACSSGSATSSTTVVPPIGIVFFDPAVADDCPGCPANPLLVWNNQDVFDVLVAITDLARGGRPWRADLAPACAAATSPTTRTSGSATRRSGGRAVRRCCW